MRQSLNAAAVGLGVQDMASHEFWAVAEDGIDTSHVDSYHRIAPQNRIWQAIGQSGRPMTDSMIMTKSDFRRSSMYTDWFQPQGFDGVMAAPVLADRTHSGVIVAFSGSRREDFDVSDLRLLTDLTPHLGLSLRLRLDRMRITQDLSANNHILDECYEAFVLLNADFHVCYTNATADALLARGEGLFLKQGKLSCRNQAELREVLRTAARASDGFPSGGTCAIARGDQRRPLLLEITSLNVSDAALFVCGAAAVAVKIIDPEFERAPTPVALQQLLNAGVSTRRDRITSAEASALIEVARSATQEEAASHLNRSKATIASHLHRAYGKIGLRDVPDVLALLAGLGFHINRM